MQECYFCGAKQPTIEAAIDSGWVPSFWDGQDETCWPVCAKCCEIHLELDPSGCELVRVTD